jgi:hypothetical protein
MSSINTEGIPSTIASFVQNFYKLSDNGTAHEGYTNSFLYNSDFFFQIGPMKPAKTSQDVMQWREKAWEAVATRKHTVYEVFPSKKQENELMLYGRVDFEKKNGDKAGASWAGRMIFDKSSVEKGEPKLAFYNVWIVSI